MSSICYIEGFKKPENCVVCKLTRGVTTKYCCLTDEFVGTEKHPRRITDCPLKIIEIESEEYLKSKLALDQWVNDTIPTIDFEEVINEYTNTKSEDGDDNE